MSERERNIIQHALSLYITPRLNHTNTAQQTHISSTPHHTIPHHITPHDTTHATLSRNAPTPYSHHYTHQPPIVPADATALPMAPYPVTRQVFIRVVLRALCRSNASQELAGFVKISIIKSTIFSAMKKGSISK